MSAPDTLVIGGGHDGLIAATALARAGRQVVLCEARALLGGRCAREEFHPGYAAPGLLHDTAGLRPTVIEALDLPRHGLRLDTAHDALWSPATDGPGLTRVENDGEMVAALRRVSENDAWAWRAWREQVQRLSPFVASVVDADAPDPEPHGFAGAWDLLRLGLGLRRLGARDMTELLRIGPMAVRDWLGDHFRTGRLAALLALPAVGGTWLGPWSAGSAARLLLQEATRGPGVVGGPAGLIDALARAAAAAGVQTLTGACVQRIRVETGRVIGVTLTDGRELDAALVLSSLEPRRTLLGLLPRRSLPVRLAERLTHWRVRGTTAVLRLALEGDVPWARANGRAAQRAVIADDLADIERGFDPVKYGRLGERPVLDVRVAGPDDGALAPGNGSVLTALVSYVPYDLRGGWTDGARDALQASVMRRLEEHAPGLGRHVVGRQLLTPVDLEQTYGLTGGQLHHGEPALDQWLHLRPDPELARGATPVGGLFLCGAGRHPGGDVNGMAGLLGARAALASLAR